MTAIDPSSLPIDLPPAAASQEMVIQPKQGWIAIDWAEMFRYRELLYFLVWRDVKVRYKQTVLGFAWAIIQPLMNALISVLIFGTVASFQKYLDPFNTPYMMFALVGQIVWQFFQTGVSAGGMSLVNQQHLLTKIYFPRLYVPSSLIGSYLVDLAIGLSLFAVLMPFYRHWPTWNLLALPLVILLAFAATLGIGLVLAAVTLLYRDLRFVVPFALQLLIYVSGVVVPMEMMGPKIRYIAALNPIFGVVSASRSSILGSAWDFGPLAVSVLSTALILTFGLFFFRKTERLIADIV